MPTYQNSAGNTGIARQYGEWRYFNSSLQSLGEYRGARLNVRVSPSMAQAKTNYWQALTGLLGTVGKTFEAYRDYSYQLADKYVDKHGINSYNKAMVDNQVPIQNNPLAMERIKERQGQILSGLVNSDFNSRIENGEFVGKSPFAVEAAMIEAKSQAPEELSKYLPFDIANDYAFNEGYWGGSQKQRDQANLKNVSVTSDRIKQQALINISGVVNGMVDQGYSIEDVFAKIKEFEETEGIYFDPSEKTKLYSSIFERGSLRADGKEFLDYIANQKVPGTTGTFRDLYGEEFFQTLKIKADNAKLVESATNYYDFLDTLWDLTNKPDGNIKLTQMLDQEIRTNGGIKTKRTEAIYESIEKWKSNQKTLLKSAESENKRTLTLASYVDYYRDKALGNTSETEESAIFRLKGEANTRKLAQQFVVGEVLNSGDTVRINTMLNNIVANGAPSELRTFTAEQFKNAFTKTTSAVEKFVNKGILPTSADPDMVPFTDAKGNNLGYVPKNLASFVEVYNMNPSAVAALVSNDKGFKDDMDLINMGMDMGYNPIEILGRKQAFIANNEAMKDATGTPEQQFNTLVRMSEIRGFEEDRIPKAQFARVNAALDGIVLARAHKLSLVTNEKMGKCVSAAKEQVEAELAGINTFVVPRSLLLKDFAGITVDSDTIVDIANEVFVDIAKTAPGVKLPKDYDASYYDAANNTIHVIDISGNPRGDIPINVFTKKIREAFDKRNIER